jgi:acyl-coenzyme A thioesterase PaaI-like protein
MSATPDAPFPPDHPFSGPGASDRLTAAFEVDLDVTPRRLRLREAADAVRAATAELVTTIAPDEAVAEAAELVRRAAALLAGQAHGRPYEGAGEGSVSGDPRSFVDFSPLVGPANPLAPPLRIEVHEGEVVGLGEFGDAYEGPPGCLHGGFIAAAFDEVLGFAQSLTGRPGMTARLAVHYRSPTPLHETLAFRGRVDRVEGRKIHTVATLHAGNRLCAEAEALFVSVDPAVFAALNARREAGGPRPPG